MIYNADDPILNDNCQNTNPKIFSFGLKDNSHNLLTANKDNIFEGKSPIIDLQKIALTGKHNISNILAAATAAKILNVTNNQISMAISNFSGIEHRLEKVVINNGVAYYNDSKATNIESVIAAIQSFSSSIILILGGKDKDNNFDELIPFINKNVKKIISYGQASNKISIALRDAVELDQVFSLRDAVELCQKSAAPGDTILLSPGCASFDQFKNYEERGNEFKRLVNEMAQA
jgi:UDP-N-acetylmuramoylalanine--D-glutamate ligase